MEIQPELFELFYALIDRRTDRQTYRTKTIFYNEVDKDNKFLLL